MAADGATTPQILPELTVSTVQRWAYIIWLCFESFYMYN